LAISVAKAAGAQLERARDDQQATKSEAQEQHQRRAKLHRCPGARQSAQGPDEQVQPRPAPGRESAVQHQDAEVRPSDAAAHLVRDQLGVVGALAIDDQGMSAREQPAAALATLLLAAQGRWDGARGAPARERIRRASMVPALPPAVPPPAPAPPLPVPAPRTPPPPGWPPPLPPLPVGCGP
jgi:hypothetical protein